MSAPVLEKRVIWKWPLRLDTSGKPQAIRVPVAISAARFRAAHQTRSFRGGSMSALSRSCQERLTGKERKFRTDLGIAIAHAISPPGKRWTFDEIAIFAGCCEGAILLIEQKALR